jgi:hypothetical protein
MSMNEIVMTGSDLLIFGVAIAVSFILGALFKLRRNVLRQRHAVELGERDLKVLTDRCERQQLGMTRLNQEVTDMRQAMLQQALALTPTRPALQVAAAPEPVAAPTAPVPVPVSVQVDTPPRAPEVTRANVDAAVSHLANRNEQAPAPLAASKPQLKAVPSSGSAAPKPKVSKPAVSDPAQLARAGAGAEVLMNRCGLSRVEAQLVISVHGAACAPRKHGT